MTAPPPPVWTSRTSSRVNTFAKLISAGLTCAMAVMLVRVAQLQLVPSVDLAGQEESRVTSKAELPARGDLLDRKGRLLATTRFGYRVVVDPTLVPDPPDTLIVSLAHAIELPEEQLGRRLLAVIAENQRRAASREVALAGGSADAAESPTQPSLADEDHPPSSPDLPYDDQDEPTAPIRYVLLGGTLTDPQAAAVESLKLSAVHLEQRPVREYVGGPDVAKIVGKVGPEELAPTPPRAPSKHEGLIGAERALNTRLTGDEGRVSYVRDAYGHPLWVEPGYIRPANPGEDIRLSIDVEVQRIAREELERGIRDAGAAGGRVVVLDPATGELLAMADIVGRPRDAVPYPWVPEPVKPGKLKKGQSPPPAARIPSIEDFPRSRYIVIKEDPSQAVHPALARNRCIEDIYEPGSTFKPFVWSTITELKRAGLDEVFDTEGGRWTTSFGRHIEDVTKRQTMTWREVLINSSNIGMIKGSDRLSFKELHDTVLRFGFGKPTSIGLAGEASGIVTPMSRWSKYTQTSVPTGYEVAVTPVQMARAFSVFCRPARLAGTMPQLRMTAVQYDDPDVSILYRVLPADIAVLTRQTMTGVADAMEKKLAVADPSQTGWLYTMFGKSGTAEIPLGKAPKGKRAPRGSSGYFDDQYNTSFIAGAPLEDPRLVVLCVIDDPGPERVKARTHYGAVTAGPVVRRVIDRTLSYMGVPPSIKPLDPAVPSTLTAEAIEAIPAEAATAAR